MIRNFFDIQGDALIVFESSILNAQNLSIHDIQKGVSVFNGSVFTVDGMQIKKITSESDALEIFTGSVVTITNGIIKESDATCVNLHSGKDYPRLIQLLKNVM